MGKLSEIMEDQLRPCPFCGCGYGNLYFVTVDERGYETVGIFCNVCKQTVTLEENEWEGDNSESREKAVKAWNARKEEE